jgi:Na+-transporting methylmalonyl-CoA/oxaloacetate decarboxylase gamma subunit
MTEGSFFVLLLLLILSMLVIGLGLCDVRWTRAEVEAERRKPFWRPLSSAPHQNGSYAAGILELSPLSECSLFLPNSSSC